MEMGKVGAVRSEINVTPLVDVCLVLLIIFIVVQPMAQLGYNVNVPPKQTSSGNPPSDQLVVSMTADHKLFLNKQEMNQPTLIAQLGDILGNRHDKIVFFSVDDAVNYGEAMEVMDAVRNSTGYKESAAEGVKIGLVMEAVPVK
jgi:biopolymer transport protein TolR